MYDQAIKFDPKFALAYFNKGIDNTINRKLPF